jgi:hypothetical protein
LLADSPTIPLPEGRTVRRIVFGSILVLCTCLIVTTGLDSQAADPPPDSPGAKITREKKLKAKISVDCEMQMLKDIIPELQGGLKDAKQGTIRIKPDPKAGITLTTRMTIKAKNVPFEDVLDKLFTDCGRPWGYYVYVSVKKDDQDDGALIIVSDPTCRGYPPGDPRNKKGDATPPKKDKK